MRRSLRFWFILIHVRRGFIGYGICYSWLSPTTSHPPSSWTTFFCFSPDFLRLLTVACGNLYFGQSKGLEGAFFYCDFETLDMLLVNRPRYTSKTSLLPTLTTWAVCFRAVPYCHQCIKSDRKCMPLKIEWPSCSENYPIRTAYRIPFIELE